jgi:CHASE2 domain-containing sensor protein
LFPGPPIRLRRVYNVRMTTPFAPPGADRIIRWIMVAIVVWGAILAVGAWTLNHDIRRPIMVMACVLGFLAFWLAMLRTLKRPPS